MKVPKIYNKNMKLNLPGFNIFCLQIWLVSGNFSVASITRKRGVLVHQGFHKCSLAKTKFWSIMLGLQKLALGDLGTSTSAGLDCAANKIPKSGMQHRPGSTELWCGGFSTAPPPLILAICTMIYVPWDVFGACICVFLLGDREADCSWHLHIKRCFQHNVP